MKQGILTKKIEWAKHLRPWGKRVQWHKERGAEARDIDERMGELDWYNLRESVEDIKNNNEENTMKMIKEPTMDEEAFLNVLAEMGEEGLFDDIRDELIELSCSYQFIAHAETQYMALHDARYYAFGMRFKLIPTSGQRGITILN